MLRQKGFAIIKNHFGNISITAKDGRLDVFDDYNSAAHCLDDSDLGVIEFKIEEVVILRAKENE